MAINPLLRSGSAAQDAGVTDVLEHLATCTPFSMARTKGRWSKGLDRAATTANLIGLSTLPLFALAAVSRHVLGALAGVLNWPLLVTGLALPLVGVLSLLCTIASDILHLIEMHRHRGRHWAAAYVHDNNHVDGLIRFEQDKLRAADAWLEQTSKRAERRQGRIFGGNDKVAVLTLVAAGWTAWKEVHGVVVGAEPSWLLWGLAFASGLSLGGLIVSKELERIAFLRDLLALAIKRQEATTHGSVAVQSTK